MKHIPIVAHHLPNVSASNTRRIERLAEEIRLEKPELRPREEFHPCVATREIDGPVLHVDDLSGISLMDEDMVCFQHRARLRAGDGDLVVSCSDPVDGYEEYCRDLLGLGQPDWLRANAPQDRMHVAEAAWKDREVRRTIVNRIRNDDLLSIHPHMGTLPIWELALLLSKNSHRPVSVIAPPPNVTKWANDKVQFTDVVRRLFGDRQVPHTTSAWNLSTAAVRAKELAAVSETVGIKIPDSAGSKGNFVIAAKGIAGKSLVEIEQRIRAELNGNWNGEQPLLISEWSSDVLCSPSVQLWLSPDRDRPPVVEGVFVQATTGENGRFVGNLPAEFPHALTEEIVDRSWMLGRLFQLVGYVGRCSFDMILLGDSLANSMIEFIECNGRWGGTSLPMTLMNRIFGDWKLQPYASHVPTVEELNTIRFPTLLQALSEQLFDHRSRTGRFILYNPGRIQSNAIGVIAIGDTWQAAKEAAFTEFPRRLYSTTSPSYQNSLNLIDAD